jgi:hypothetical protein
MLSLGLLGLFLVWVIDGDLNAKIKAFYNNKTALIISSIYIITVLGLLHTANFEFALDDLRRKLPLFFLPFFISGFHPITKKELYILLQLYLLGVLMATLWSLFVFLGGLNEPLIDSRDLSRFNSHIRFGLEITLAIFISFYFLYKSKKLKQRLLWAALSSWFIGSLLLFNLFSGLVVFAITSILLLISLSIQTKRTVLKRFSIPVFLFFAVNIGLFLGLSLSEFNTNRVKKEIEQRPFTAKGNKYRVDKKSEESSLKENGYFVEKHIADQEFADAWNRKSKINYDALDRKGNEIRFTLRRFITSKGQRKDDKAIDQLSQLEVDAIEKGVPNSNYLEMGYFKKRLFKILWEYQYHKEGRSNNGHSVLMRWEYWRTATQIIQKNWLFGVGTGDVQDAFNAQYILANSSLENKYRLRTHNQFLAYGVSFGVIGFFSFLFLLFYPFVKLSYYKNNIYFAFFSIIMLSMLFEDTLEIQVGINFFAFFNTLFLLKSKETHPLK